MLTASQENILVKQTWYKTVLRRRLRFRVFLTSFTAGSLGGDFNVLQRLHLFDLFNDVRLLVVKLLVLGPLRVELGQKVNELLAIAKKYFLDRTRLVRVGNKHLHSATEHQPLSQTIAVTHGVLRYLIKCCIIITYLPEKNPWWLRNYQK